MIISQRNFVLILTTLISAVTLTSCGGGGGGGGSAGNSCENVAGTWIATQSINDNTCGTTIDTCKAYVIAQNGCSIIVSDSTGTYYGSVNNRQVTWAGSFVDNGSAMITSADLSVPTNPLSPNGLSGTVAWKNESGSCSGSATMDAMNKPAATITSTTPLNSAQNVPIDSLITASFSGNMLFSPYGTFTVSANNNPIAGTPTGPLNNTVTFTPSNYLEYNTTYTVTITKNLNCGTWAAPMLNDYTWSFSTGSVPTSDFWTPTAVTDAPAARKAHTAIWTGAKMIVWGGQDSNSTYAHVNSGGVYDPVTDIWTATSATAAPSARYGHTAIWTGTKMIVWGGYDGSQKFNTGGVYDPVSDIWTDVSTTNAPSGRNNHTAVWTGSEMIIWGGWGPIFTTATGAKYNPDSNTWTSLSTTNAPSVGFDKSTAIWTGPTGSEMIVWGGDTVNNIGAKYDPLADIWTAVSVTNAPTPRTGHTAIWTGSRIIVWGGSDNSALVINTGGVYDPAADTWKPMSTANAPSARKYHTAVWTGSKMIVWGGYGESGGQWSSNQDLDTGGVYDPVSDSWSPLSGIYAPSAREGHSAVWSGSSMIIWGGLGTSVTNTGGRYTP